MVFITPSTLTQAVKYFGDILKDIASDLLYPTSPDYEQRKREFMEAADKYDDDQVNKLINDAINNYCHTTDTAKALEEWCAKFGIKPDYPIMGEFDWVRLIARNENQIDGILSNEGL